MAFAKVQPRERSVTELLEYALKRNAARFCTEIYEARRQALAHLLRLTTRIERGVLVLAQPRLEGAAKRMSIDGLVGHHRSENATILKQNQ